jgi:hypothetical protein
VLFQPWSRALAQFRKDFDAIVAARGWTGWTGEGTAAGRAWRTQIIYDTNLRTAYQAGRWAQVQEVKSRRPYLEYRHSDASIHPRELHKSWDGLVVAVDDPWVTSHWPPNGWGCKCRMYSIGPRDLARMGKSGPDTPPNDGTREWTDKVTGETHTIPRGIDPGWDYAPGASRADLLRQQFEAKAKTLPGGIGQALTQDMEKLPAVRGARAEAIRYVTESGQREAVEFAAVYDAAGRTVLRKRGIQNSVEFSLAELDEIRAAETPVMVHNHTKEGSLSIDDWIMHADVPLAEIVAVTPSGTVYHGATLERRRILDHYDLIQNVVGAGLTHALNRDDLSEVDANRFHAHAINRVLAGLDWVSYGAIEADGFPLKEPAALAALIDKIVAAMKARL